MTNVHIIQAWPMNNEGPGELESLLKKIRPKHLILNSSEESAKKTKDRHDMLMGEYGNGTLYKRFPYIKPEAGESKEMLTLQMVKLSSHYDLWVPLEYASSHEGTQLHFVDISSREDYKKALERGNQESEHRTALREEDRLEGRDTNFFEELLSNDPFAETKRLEYLEVRNVANSIRQSPDYRGSDKIAFIMGIESAGTPKRSTAEHILREYHPEVHIIKHRPNVNPDDTATSPQGTRAIPN